MHECPDCGMVCDCDGQDLWMDVLDPEDCTHECEEDEDEPEAWDFRYLDDPYSEFSERGN